MQPGPCEGPQALGSIKAGVKFVKPRIVRTKLDGGPKLVPYVESVCPDDNDAGAPTPHQALISTDATKPIKTFRYERGSHQTLAAASG